MSDPRIFDRRAVRAHRRRAASSFADHDFLFREVADRLAERLLDIQRPFTWVAEIDARGPILEQALRNAGVFEHRGISRYLRLTDDRSAGPSILADPELLPLAPQAVDLLVSNLALHWVNDLPGLLVQARRALRPDGMLLASLLGGQTLHELRAVLLEAESEIDGGVSPRVSPFADIRDTGALLQRAGLALPVSDVDSIDVTYQDAFALLRDLRGMGETNAVRDRRRAFSRRAMLMRAAELYHERHRTADGRIHATFQVLYLAGWAPHESQQKPLRPGSAKGRLADALGAVEHSAGEKARPR
ncbi:MAG: methyltransferase domain-containing protein [Alphaproteobacteria bacterium]|nr:methyltransferase domain-containing protein [Alphaproteobacteria bacterium]